MRPMLQEDEEGPLQDPRQDEHQDHLFRREEQCRDGVRAVRRRQAVQEALLRGRPGDQGDARQRQGTEGGVQRQGRRRRREAEGAQGRRQGGEAQGRRRKAGEEGRPEGRQGEAQGRRGRQAGEEGQVRRRAAGLGREARQGHAAAAARHEHGRPWPAPREDEAGQVTGRRRTPAAARRATGPADDRATRGGPGCGRAVHLAGAGRAHVLQLRPDALRPAVVLRRRVRRRVRRGVSVLQAGRAGRRVLRRAGARPPGVVPRQPAAVLPAAAAAAAAVLRRGPQRRVQRHVIDRRHGQRQSNQASVISHQCVCGHSQSHVLTHGLWLKFSFSFLRSCRGLLVFFVFN